MALVKVVLLDSRWFRDAPNEDFMGRDVFGEEQWTWFEAELNDSARRNIAFTLVGLGTQVSLRHSVRLILPSSRVGIDLAHACLVGWLALLVLLVGVGAAKIQVLCRASVVVSSIAATAVRCD
jgi:hypothetical protein